MLENNALNLIYMHFFSYFIPFIFILFFLYKWLLINSSKIHNLPPSPPKLPIIGHLHMMGLLPHRALLSLSKQYGELMLIYLGSKPTLIVSTAKLAKEIMKTNDAIISNRFQFSINKKLFYNCMDVVTSPYGEYWRQMKSIFVLHLLSSKRVRSFRGVREEETSLLVENIEKKSGSIVNLSHMFMVLANDLVCRVAFGKKYSEKQEESGVNFDVIKEFVELLGVFNVGDFIPWLGWINRFNGLNEKVNRVASRFDNLLEEIIGEHIDQLNRQVNNGDGDCENENDEVKDFVDVLLKAQKEKSLGFALQRESIKAMILDAFAAGTDTTYTVLEWAMTELLKNPNIMKKLQNEVREIAGDNKDGICENDLEKMKYLKAVMKETLRLYPPIPLLVPRESTQDVKVNGYDIPKGTLVFVNAWAVQRDPSIWDEPERFRPERFLNSSIELKGHTFELIPFGGGRRICPAVSFVISNNELVLANLMYKFDWKLPDGVTNETIDMSESAGLTIHRETPLLAIATSRIFC